MNCESHTHVPHFYIIIISHAAGWLSDNNIEVCMALLSVYFVACQSGKCVMYYSYKYLEL